ncbi:hypothetical protein F4803DRAFT_527827 [Xylaria telfairii]|nr:hypothetical protein F4803DRAFT_527827 [Xylaria telfairii]
MISQKLLSSIDILTVAQSKEFTNLSSFIQRLINDLIEQRKAQEINNTILAGKLDSVNYDMQLRLNEADRTTMREKILGSLFFPEIDERRSLIKEPAPDTLGWLFGSTSIESGYGTTIQPPWSNFRQWLREDTSMYWVSGKAGSGKSTLMAHIVEDERTHEELNLWRDGRTLNVLSFFFWRAGTQLQNSVPGLLRSLLYQLCRLHPAIADNIVAGLSSPAGAIPVWTERNLRNHITTAIQSSQEFRFCVFIDGLDEFTGDYNDLVDYINQLQAFSNLKVCASSRPELELATRFQGLKQLCLQDLNRGDIKRFVHQSLATTQLNEGERASLAGEVVRRSEGVFLWASLVTQSLLKGSMAGDDLDTLHERLDSLPRDLRELFRQMLTAVDDVYRKSLALYVQLKVVEREFCEEPFGIPIIAILQLKKRINSYEEFVKECESTEIQIATRSAGLLEVRSTNWQRYDKSVWKRAGRKFTSNKPCFMPGVCGLERRKCAGDEPCPAIFEHEDRTMEWIHRSAFEFLSGPDGSMLESGLGREVLLRKLSESCLSYLLVAPSYGGLGGDTVTVSRLHQIMRFVHGWYNNYPKMASAFLDNLGSRFTQFDTDEVVDSITGHWFSDEYTAETAFWSYCGEHRHWPYVSSRIGRILESTACGSLIAHLLAMAITGTRQRGAAHRICPQAVNNLAQALLQLTVQLSRPSHAAQAPTHKCIAAHRSGQLSRNSLWHGILTCATWKELIPDGSMTIMTRLIYILAMLTVADDIRLPPIYRLPFREKVSEQLFALMEMTDLYVAPEFGLNRIFIQISAKAWARFCYSAFPLTADTALGYIASHISAVEVCGAVRILCVPSVKGHWPEDRCLVTELRTSQYISIHPSIETSDRLLSLLYYYSRWGEGVRFKVCPNTREQFNEVCESLLQEIKSVEQGLDGGQQLIAAACIRVGLLGANVAYGPRDVYPRESSESSGSSVSSEFSG